MNWITKVQLISGPALVSFTFAFTSPTIHIYFMRLVSPELLAFSNLLEIGFAALVNASVPIERIKDLYRRYFALIVVVDLIGFCTMSFLSVEYVAVRFIGLSLLNAISTNLWWIVIRDAVNHIFSKSELTDWDSTCDMFRLGFAFVGGLLVFMLSNIDVEICILLQCLANIFMGIMDLMAYRKICVKGGEKSMRFARHNEKYSMSYKLFGRKNNFNVEVIYNEHFNEYYFYIKDLKSEEKYYSLHNDIRFDNEEACMSACMEKLEDMIKLLRRKSDGK